MNKCEICKKKFKGNSKWQQVCFKCYNKLKEKVKKDGKNE